MVGMEAPKREHVEPVLSHHVEKCLPEFEIFAGVLVLLDGKAGAVGSPRKIELDGAKLELRLHRAVLNLVPGRAQADLLG